LKRKQEHPSSPKVVLAAAKDLGRNKNANKGNLDEPRVALRRPQKLQDQGDGARRDCMSVPTLTARHSHPAPAAGVQACENIVVS